MRDHNLGNATRPELPAAVGLSEDSMLELYRLLAVAKYEDRYVIPAAHAEVAKELDDLTCSLDSVGGPGGDGPHGSHGSGPGGAPRTMPQESFHVLKGVESERRSSLVTTDAVNLPHWDGKGVALGMPPIRKQAPEERS